MLWACEGVRVCGGVPSENASAYNASCRNGWIKDFTWFVDGHKLGLNGKWTDAMCTLEAQKYRRKVDFQKGVSGAYRYAATHGLLKNSIGLNVLRSILSLEGSIASIAMCL